MPSTGRRVVAPEPKTKKKSGLLECYHQFATLRACRREPDCLLRCSELGLEACVAPLGAQSDPTDQITDVGADAQFQLVMSTH